MAQSYSISPIVQIEFEQAWEQRLQQMGSLLLSRVKRVTLNGYVKRITQLGSGEMSEITGRSQASNPDNSDLFIRWLRSRKFQRTTWIDEWDPEEIGMLPDPQGPHMEQHVMAYGRKCDAVIRDALGGNAITGEDQSTLTALPSGNIIAKDYVAKGSAVTSGLTFAKVAQAKYLLDHNKVPKTGRTFVCSSQEEQDLIRDVDELKNSRYTQVQPITDGTLDGRTWMGFNWVTGYEDLTVVASVRQCYAFQKDFVAFGDGQRRASVDLLPAQNHSTQVRTRARMNATRTQEEAVIQILCSH